MGVANLTCTTNGAPDGATACILASLGVGGVVGFGAGTVLAGPWMAGRRGLDYRRVRTRTWIALSAGVVLSAVSLGVLSPVLVLGVPLMAATAARKTEGLSVAPLLSSEVQGLALSGRF
jgi:hypothetical protein